MILNLWPEILILKIICENKERKAFCGLYIRVRVSRFGADPNSGVRELKNNGALDHPSKGYYDPNANSNPISNPKPNTNDE